MKPIEQQLAELAINFRTAIVAPAVLQEARKRILDSLGCFYGAFNEKAVVALRETFVELGTGPCSVWGLGHHSLPGTAAWLNGSGVRALDFNDTYLSKEPCHPSDLLSSLWAACELSQRPNQGSLLMRAMVLSYEVLCRLCDAASLRTRGWDHVTYLPIASAVGCSYILGLNRDQTRNAIALATIGNNAMRQTRVGTISDWKAACAAYAAQAGLNATLLARRNFTGPHDIFAGKHGFFAQVSGPFQISEKALGQSWKIMDTHTKYFPAEHHAQSAIEAALQIRHQLQEREVSRISAITIDVFDVATAIIGSEKEKWLPSTRETADHSLPYLIAAALLDGNITLSQYQSRRYLKSDARRLMRKVRVRSNSAYTRLYPKQMPTQLSLRLTGGKTFSVEVMSPKGYAGRPMSWQDVSEKFQRLVVVFPEHRQRRILERIAEFDHVDRLASLQTMMRVPL